MYIKTKGLNTKKEQFYIYDNNNYKKIPEKKFVDKEKLIEKKLLEELDKLLLKEELKSERNNKINPF